MNQPVTPHIYDDENVFKLKPSESTVKKSFVNYNLI